MVPGTAVVRHREALRCRVINAVEDRSATRTFGCKARQGRARRAKAVKRTGNHSRGCCRLRRFLNNAALALDGVSSHTDFAVGDTGAPVGAVSHTDGDRVGAGPPADAFAI